MRISISIRVIGIVFLLSFLLILQNAYPSPPIDPPDPQDIYELGFLNTYNDSFPFSACKSLVIDDTISEHPICFMGSGGGVYILDITGVEPSLFALATGLGNKLKTNGFVWDLVKRNESGLIRLFCAAGRAGIYSWTMGTTAPFATALASRIYLPANNIARSVDYFEYQGNLFLVVGTFNTGVLNIQSKIYLIDYSTGAIIDDEIVEGVWNLDVTTSLGTDPIVFVADGAGGLKSYKVDVSNPSNLNLVFEDSFPTAPDTIVARDVIFDEISTGSGKKILYAACYRDGIYTFDVSNPADRFESKILSWDDVGRDRAVDGLDIYQEGSNLYLCIAAGHKYRDEMQAWGTDDDPDIGKTYPSPEPLNDPALLLYDITQVYSGNPVFKFEYKDDSRFYSVATYFHSASTQMRAYTACDAQGLHVFKLDVSVPDIIRVGSYDNGNDVPLGSVDDVIVRGDYIYTASETALQTYLWTASSGPLSDLTDFDLHAGFWIEEVHYPDSSLDEDKLYASSHVKVDVFDINTPSNPDHEVSIERPGRRHGVFPLDLTVHGTIKRHMYVAYHKGFPSGGINTGALGIWNITDHNNYSLAGCYYSLDLSGTGTGGFIDVAVKKVGNLRYAYVSFSQSAEQNVGAGVHCFEIADLSPPDTNQRIILRKTLAVTNLPRDGMAAQVKLSDDEKRVYGAFGWGGIGVFDVDQDPADPVLIGSRRLYGSALHVRPVTEGGSIYAIVSLLSGYIAILDVTDANTIQNSDIYYYRAPFQPNVTCPDPLNPTNPHYMILADGRGGVRRVEAVDFP